MITVIANLKGGTGKSTITFNLSLWVAKNCNTYVSVYDLDPQATLTDALEIRAEDGHAPVITPSNDVSLLAKEGVKSECIIDIGMADQRSMEVAISQADRVVVPIGPSSADVWSTQRFLKMISDISNKKKLEVFGFMNRADTHHNVRETDEAYEAMKTLSGITMLDARVYQRTIYRRSFSEGMAVFELDPRSKATEEINTLGKALYKI
ncbi:MAG: AAA family ATPase [Thiotrichaceae bacterium]|nr:AAA family ATPase [Thiotrichaceae bacterium]